MNSLNPVQQEQEQLFYLFIYLFIHSFIYLFYFIYCYLADDIADASSGDQYLRETSTHTKYTPIY